MKPFLAVKGEPGGSGHLLRVVWRRGEVVETIRHYPWFVANIPVRGPGVAGVERLPGFMLLYSPADEVYKAAGRAYKIKTDDKWLVPRIAAQVLARNGRAGMYNIVYEVRAGYDLQYEHGYGLLGFPTPLAFIPNREMVERMEEVLEAAGDLKVLAVDIEVYSRRGGFPARGDPLISVSYAVFRLGDYIFTPDWPEGNVKYILNEEASPSGSYRVVRDFVEVVRREEPDIVVTYNGSGFDFPYMEPYAAATRFYQDFVVLEAEKRYIPHVDLMTVRDRLGSSLGVRSQAAYALDDVALEVARTAAKFHEVSWLFNSRYVEAERRLDHAKLKEYFDRRDQIVYDYIVADVYLTVLLARVWLYPLILLATLTGIPLNVLQRMNTGQMAEYVFTELMRRLRLYPELRARERGYSRLSTPVRATVSLDGEPNPLYELKKRVQDFWVFERGKVYVRGYGLYGGNGKKVVELDFAQLYPTDMVVNTADPTSVFTLGGYKASRERLETKTPTLRLTPAPRVAQERSAWVLLSKTKRAKKRGEEREVEVYRVAPGYGPISWLVYKLYVARNETKKLKKRAKAEKRVELLAPDQAVKIFNNSGYGSFSKRRGNLVHELLSAAVFWRTQKLLYDVIRAVETEIAERLGRELVVLYGDTDSTYILVDEDVDGEELARAVNEWIRERYGPLYRMELEGEYAVMLIPRHKHSDEPSAKSYIVLDWSGKIVKAKGDFFKLNAPLALRERLAEFYEELVRRRPQTPSEVEVLIAEFLRDAPGYKLFIKKSVSEFVDEDDPRRFKNLNKEFHYAALVHLCETSAAGAQVVERTSTSRGRVVRCRVDPRVVEETQRTVIVLYLPHMRRDSRKFIVYRGERGGRIEYSHVEVAGYTVRREPGENKEDQVDKYIEIEYRIRDYEASRERFMTMLLQRIRRTVTMTLYEKLVKAMR